MAVVAGGGQAELITVHERAAMPVPEELDWTAAGGVPEVFTTAHDALFSQGGLTTGERLLVHGAAGGVGMAAVQLGAMAGARVTATVRNEQARARIAALGINAIAPEGFEEEGPFDVILELVGAPNMAGNLQALAMNGRICVIGIGAGAKVEAFDLRMLMGKRARIHGSTLRALARGEGAVRSCGRARRPPRLRLGRPQRAGDGDLPARRGGRRRRTLPGRREAREDRARTVW
jgi:NADPH:quinone reductase-like Zn-dependent oxidoreductase